MEYIKPYTSGIIKNKKELKEYNYFKKLNEKYGKK